MSKVYFLKTDKASLNRDKIAAKIFEPFPGKFGKDEKVALKLHVGEPESDTYLDPSLVESIYRETEERVEGCVLMDCNVLYKSKRSMGDTHREVAETNGFDFAPFVVADGQDGSNELVVGIEGGEHFDKVRLGGALEDFNSVLAVSHFTGHIINGMGGALKNIGMGLGSKKGKMEMHAAFELQIDGEKCIACGTCIENCPAEAITIDEGGAKIDHEKCIGCGTCIAICPEEAVKIPWGSSSSEGLQERIDEYAKGVLKGRKSLFVNVLLDVTPECDCINKKQEPMVDDIGILISDDPVAIDQASLDLIGDENFEQDVDRAHALEYAESLGLGERDYELIEIK